MKFTHLPVDGGLYDQHPKLLDDWFVIMEVEGEHQAQENARREARQNARLGHRGNV